MRRKITIKRLVLYIVTYGLTGIFRALILFIPFKQLAKIIGIEKGEYQEISLSQQQRVKLKTIRQVVNSASKRTPWQSLCMVQALTAMTLLKVFKIKSILYMGLKKDESEGLIAHAWLRAEKYIVTGKKEMDGFNIITWYISK